MGRKSYRFIAILTLWALVLTAIPVAAAPTVPDSKGHWAEAPIQRLVDLGAVSGLPDGTFRPDLTVTRAEFVSMVNKSLGITPVISSSRFKDVKPGDWFAGQVEAAAVFGYVTGNPDGTFSPYRPITREQAAAMLVRAFGFSKLDAEAEQNAVLASFTDADKVSAWAKADVATAVSLGLMSGYTSSTLAPQPVGLTAAGWQEWGAARSTEKREAALKKLGSSGLITRAQTAAMLVRALDQKPAAQATVFDKAGTYGPANGAETISGDVIIKADGVTLQNLIITGDLTIAESVGDGTVTMENVTVKGKTEVKGGGTDSVIFRDCTLYGTITVEKVGGQIRIVAEGSTSVPQIILQSGAILISRDDGSFEQVLLPAGLDENMEVILIGNFAEVKIAAPKSNVTIGEGSKIRNLILTKNATGSKVDLDKKASVTTVTANAGVQITGQGSIGTAEINVDGVTIEQKPDKIVLKPGVKANVDGKDVSEPKKSSGGGGGPSKPSEEPVSAIRVNPETMTLKAGATGTITATVEPGNATGKTVTWTTSDANVVTVTNGVVTAKLAGTATITATAGGKTATCTVFVESSEDDFEFDEGTITGYNGNGGVVVIPSTINGIEVKTIGEEAFYKEDEETGDTIPNNITSIIILNTVTSIEAWAFCDCTDLTSVTIPNSVTSIGVGVFADCINLTSVTFQETSKVITIGDYAFGGCESLASMTIPNNVTSIGAGAFYGCAGLTSITIPASVNSIGEEIFRKCYNLQSINVDTSNTVYSSAGGALYNKDKSTLLICPLGKTGLFEIPNSVITIGDYALYECTGLTSVTFQETSSVESIGESAFSECAGLTSMTIPTSVKSIGTSAFSGCTSLKNVTIPNSVISIGDWAFAGCGLTSITIPNSITSIAENTFKECIELTNVIFQETSSVESIGDGAFSGCTVLESITIPYGVTSIGQAAFYNCTSLKSATIPNTVESIANSVFYYCEGLESVIIPESVTSMGNYVFTECRNLSTAYFYGDAPTMGDYVFRDMKSGFKVYYKFGATGFTTPTWQPSAIGEYNSAIFVDNDIATLGLVGTTVTSSAEGVSRGEFSADKSKIHIIPEGAGTATITVKNDESHEATIGVKVAAEKAITSVEITKYGAAPDTVINIAAIAGVTAPVTDAAPAAAITATDQYTGTVTWSPEVVGDKFAASTAYTATITLTPKAGYTFTGVAENFFTVAGASATNAANSGVVTALFPATGAVPLTQLTIEAPSNLQLQKVYDGTTATEVAANTETLSGVLVGDQVSISAEANFDDKNVGTNKTITVVYTLGGADAGKYIPPVDWASQSGEIKAKTLKIDSLTVTTTKEYDGTTATSVTNIEVSGVVEGEEVTVKAEANFDSPDVGTDRTITVVFTLEGEDAGNYAAPKSQTYTYWCIIEDTTVPTPGNNGTITTEAVTDTTLTLNWTKATDLATSEANLKYFVYQSDTNNIGSVEDAEDNGTLLNDQGTADIATFDVTGLTAETTYYFNVVVADEAGNKAAYTTKSEATAAESITGATIDPTTAVFDKKAGAQADVTTTITWNSAGSVTAIKKDGTALNANTDYAVDGTTLTIKKNTWQRKMLES